MDQPEKVLHNGQAARPMKKAKGSSKEPTSGISASRRIDAKIKELNDWRGKTLARIRKLIKQADSEVVEEWKWRGVPVWSHAGIICTGETYKNVVKLTFAKGASLEDPAGLFNSSLSGNTRRAIDIHEGDKIDEKALKALIRAAVTMNTSSTARRPAATTKVGAKTTGGEISNRSPKGTKKAPARQVESKPKLLAGGNPQIAKADGDAPVQAYIAAMPGWKRDIGRRIDAIIERSVPHVHKAVKWNSPFYGVEGQGWFLSFHVFTRYVKVTFFQGASLRPLPPGESKHKDTRYLDIYEGKLDEKQLAAWVKQAAALPGWGA